jgi:tetratricopeptide (TPR) repeat protein
VDPARLDRAIELFEALRDCPEEEVERELARLPDSEAEVRDYVAQLCSGHRRLLPELETSALEHLAPWLEAVPERIGNYTLGERLGRGGEGVVYRARQDRPDRDVALKLIGTTLLTDEDRQRFEQGIAHLGKLRHPCIAQIFEGGYWEGPLGLQPFLAMELVPGAPLVRAVHERGLDVPHRLQLLAELADALHHAHAQDLVHCDVKPGNVLLDDDGRPRLLDFGVARLIGDADGPASGTPEYMSPEQERGGRPEPGWDVYSLGRVGCLFFTPPNAPDEPRPAADPERLVVADRARAPLIAAVLRRAVAPRGERYASAGELASELRRCADLRPTVADGGRHALRLFVQRHPRWSLALGSVVAIALLLLSLQGGRLGHAKERSRLGEEQVQEALGCLRQFVMTLPQGLEAEPLADLLERYDDEAARRLKDPRVLGTVRSVLGEAFVSRGQYGRAGETLESALALEREAHGPDAAPSLTAEIDLAALHALVGRFADSETRLRDVLARARAHLGERDPTTLRAEYELGCTLLLAGEFTEAGERLEASLEGRQEALGPASLDVHVTEGMLGVLYCEQDRIEEAQPLLERALAGLTEILGPEDPLTLITLNNLALSYADLERFDEALPLAFESLELTRRKLSPRHPDVLLGRANVATLTGLNGQLQEALDELHELLDDCQQELGEQNALTLQVRHNLLDLLERADRLEEAEEQGRLALAGRREVLGPAHPFTLKTLNYLAVVLEREGKIPEAAREIRKGLEALAESPDPSPEYVQFFEAELTRYGKRSEDASSTEPGAR